MKKTLALLLVASLLLAGCTELTESTDEAGDEILKIDVNEEIALEKIDEFLTVDEDESFGITIIYEMDGSMMEGFSLGMDSEAEEETDGDSESEEEVEEVIIVEMTEAWSPDGYHSSSEMSLVSSSMNDTDSMKMVQSFTHIGTTVYFDIGYDIQGDPCEDTEDDGGFCEMMFGNLPDVQRYSMTTANTHTQVIAAMAEESQESSDDMNPMAFLEMVEMIEEYGTFTPADSVDGLQLFDVAIDPAAMMESQTPTSQDILDMCDANDNQGLSWSEFSSEDCRDEGDSRYEAIFNDADTDMSGELTADELPAFIEDVIELSQRPPTPEEALDMCDTDASNGVSWSEFMSADCDDTSDEYRTELETIFNDADIDDSGEITMDELQGFIDSVSTFYETDMDGDMEMGGMPAMQVAFSTTGDIEYFAIEMDEMGEEPVIMKMYILTEDRVNSLFTDLDAGETVALPFLVSSSMYGGSDDWDDDGGFDDQMYWYLYGYCEWEGNPDDEDDVWSCKDDQSDSYWADWWYYCEMHDDLWYCTDDYGQSSEFENSASGDRYTSGEDEMDMDDDDYESELPSDESEFISLLDADETGGISYDEFVQFIEDSMGPMDSGQLAYWTVDANEIFNDTDADGSGEIEQSEGVSILIDELDMIFEAIFYYGLDNVREFVCNDGTVIPVEYLNDGDEDCPDGEDEFNDSDDDGGMDMGDSDDDGGMDMGDSDEIIMYITTSDMYYPFEGDMSDYKIELASCDYDYDMETGEETSTCTSVISVAIADAGMNSDVMFHDADSTGTISDGDMIHIGETDVEWDEVRLYSISADAYSDENPMHDAPGFTGLIGMLALLGAAFVRRNE